jgi:ABC-type amino acid transport substrate-binding protein
MRLSGAGVQNGFIGGRVAPEPAPRRLAAMTLRTPIAAISAVLLAAAMALAATSAEALEPPAPAPIRLASLEWEPYVGAGMPDQGYVAAVIRAAFADQGLSVEIGFYPWARALLLARSGEVDGLAPEYFDPSRESEFAFSAPFPGGPLVVYKRRDETIAFAGDPVREPDAAFRALGTRRIGVVRGYLNTPAFDDADYLVKEEASDDATNLRKLVYGRIDLAVIDRRVAEHLIRSEYPDYARRIEPMAPALADKPLYVAFSRRSPRMEEAMAAFNRGLEAMRADGRLEALHERYIVNPGVGAR